MEKLTFNDNNPDSDEDHGEQEGENDCDPAFEASCSPSEPRLLTQGDLNDLVRHLSLSNTSCTLMF
jgi:hypothetical protein